MLDKFFNKNNPDSKVQKDKDTKDGVAAMRIVAKNTLVFPSIAKQLKSLNSAFGNYLKLNNIRPAVGDKLTDVTKSLRESKEISVANIKVKKYAKEKKRTFLAGILDTFVKILSGLFLASLLSIGYVVYKLTEIISPYVGKVIDKISEGITFLSDSISSFFRDVDWLDLFETSFKKYLNFISFGIINEERVNEVISQSGSFYKEMMKGFGSIIKNAIEWLAPKLQSIGRFVGKDILGVDIDKQAERRNIKEQLAKRSQELQKEYNDLDKQDVELTGKKNKLSKEKQKLQELKLKREEEEKQKKIAEAVEKEKKKPILERLFGKKEEAKPEAVPTEVKREEAKPTPTIKKEEPKVEVSKVPASDGTAAPLPEPAKQPSSAVSLQSVVEDNSPKFTPIDYSGLNPAFKKLLVEMATSYTQETGKKLLINSAYRSNQEQKELYDRWIASGKKGGVVAKPAAPLKGADGQSGAGSPHTSGTAIDIQAKGQLFGKLSGDVDNPSGWLEKFGLTRPVTSEFLIKQGKDPAKREDWHVTPLKSLPTPDGGIVANKSGKAVDLESGKKTPNYDIGKSSSEIAAEQRGQSKPQNPTYVDARTTNNNIVEKNKKYVPVPA